MAFTESDLHLSQSEIDQIKARLENLGIANALTNTITEQSQKVEDYTLRYTIPDARAKRLARPLVIQQLYVLCGMVTSASEQAYEEAMKELIDIRDGQFPDLAEESPTPSGVATSGVWGSATQVPGRL